ncbi:MAG: tetratricopeptide repeat protein [Gemmatimonadetes bacterium]|nr:tetratricopeptide repeat protein [Gemmatimonadota bacterium]
MASSSVARREVRKAVDADDAVMLRAAEMAEWTRKNARMVVTATAVLVALAAGLLYYRTWKASRADRAALEYFHLKATLASDNGQAVRQLDQFASRFDGTTESAEARIAAAQLQMVDGQPAKALPDLRTAADGSTPVKEQAMSLLASALAQTGKRQEAIDTYLKLADHTKLEYLKQDALTQAAALREQANDWNGAAALYAKAAEGLEKGSQDRAFLELHLAEARANAGKAAAPAAQ